MEMCYDGALVLPSSYAVMSEEEMTYVEGGSWNDAAYDILIGLVSAAVWDGIKPYVGPGISMVWGCVSSAFAAAVRVIPWSRVIACSILAGIVATCVWGVYEAWNQG